MAKFQVDVYEVWTRSITVEAESEDEAKQVANLLIESCSDSEDSFDYSHTMDIDDWNVEKVSEDQLVTEKVTE